MRCGSILLFSLAGLVALGPAFAQDAKGVRRIPVPHREHGYGNFKSQIITTDDQFKTFIQQVEKQQGWNHRADFIDALKTAKIDFTTEALVLIRQTEGSGSNKVTFGAVELKDGKLTSVIERKVAEIGTADIADYALALAVPRKELKAVHITVDKKEREVLRVPAQ
jgi:hypothetical protein